MDSQFSAGKLLVTFPGLSCRPCWEDWWGVKKLWKFGATLLSHMEEYKTSYADATRNMRTLVEHAARPPWAPNCLYRRWLEALAAVFYLMRSKKAK